MRRAFAYIIFWITIGILFYQCRKTKEYSFPNRVIDFTIYELVSDTSSQTDTALTSNIVRIESKYSYDSIFWQINEGPRHKANFFQQRFSTEGVYHIRM